MPADGACGGGYGWTPPDWRPGRRSCQESDAVADLEMLGYHAEMFREKNDYELDALGDEELIAYVVAAREAGNLAAAKLGFSIFAFRRFDDLVRRALVKVPTRQDAEDLAQQALEGVFKARFDVTVVGQAVNFMYTILARRIADFTDKRTNRELDEIPLPEELDDEERKRRAAAISPDETSRVDTLDVIERVWRALNETHQMVVDDFVFNSYDAKETATRVNTEFPGLTPPMTDQNVHKIASRFRDDLRNALAP